MTKKKIILLVVVGVIVIAGLVVAFNSAYMVNEGYTAALYTLGKLDAIEGSSGLHFKTPFIQSVEMIDIREQSIQITQNAYTKDTQTVENLVVKINYRLDQSALDSTIRTIGVKNVYSAIVETNVFEVTRNMIGQYTADELIGSRAEVAQRIQEDLVQRFTGKGVLLVAFTIENIDFEDSFEAAVRRKVEAEQKALEAQNQTKEAEELAKQQVIAAQAEADATKAKADADAYAVEAMAEAEAHAIRLLNEQLATNSEYVDYLKITQWDGKLPTVQGGDAAPIIDLRPGTGLGTAPAADGE